MKSTLRILGLAAVVLAVATAVAPDASATCGSPKLFQSFSDLGTKYITGFPAGASTSTIAGRFWQTGARNLANEGAYDDSNWLLSGPGGFYLSGSLADGTVVGCPTGQMVVMLTNNGGSTGQFV